MVTPAEIKVDHVYKIEGKGPTKAFCDILLSDTFLVKGLRVVQGKDSLFVSMPQEKGRDGKWHKTFYSVSKELQKRMEELVLEKYIELYPARETARA